MSHRAAMFTLLALALLGLPFARTRVLRAQTSAAALDSGLALYRQNQLSQAAEYFRRAARRDTSNTEALLYLAETWRRLGDFDRSATLARLVLAREPCSSFAHTVLAAIYYPQYSSFADASEDTTWHHALAAVACDSSDGNAWLLVHTEALRRGDGTREESALRRIERSGFLAPAALAFARWTLTSLPQNAILLTNGDLDTYPELAVQRVEGRRGDVAVVNVPMLNLPWYARLVRARFGVPLYASDAALDSAWYMGRYSPSDSIIDHWRADAQRGALPRPLAFAMSVSQDVVTRPTPGRYRLAGPYYASAPAGDTLAADTARLRLALGGVSARQLAGPATGVGDRSPVRLAQGDGMFAGNALYLWGTYVDLLVAAGRRAEARQGLASAEALVREAGLSDAYSLGLLKDMRASVEGAH